MQLAMTYNANRAESAEAKEPVDFLVWNRPDAEDDQDDEDQAAFVARIRGISGKVTDRYDRGNHCES